jgi:thiamine-phosphate pyrophosphorylase
MDQRLLTWARAVKQRSRANRPVLWYFTDEVRTPNPLPAIAALPPGLCGVVFRHNNAPLAQAAAKLCKSRRIAMVIAGNPRLAAALKTGVHLRAGRWPNHLRPAGLITSSAHNGGELRRARLAGARIIFLSPAFPTASHSGARALGAPNWNRLAKKTAYALGGITSANINRLRAQGGAAITALES